MALLPRDYRPRGQAACSRATSGAARVVLLSPFLDPRTSPAFWPHGSPDIPADNRRSFPEPQIRPIFDGVVVVLRQSAFQKMENGLPCAPLSYLETTTLLHFFFLRGWSRCFTRASFLISGSVHNRTPPPTTGGASIFFASIHACTVCLDTPTCSAAWPVV